MKRWISFLTLLVIITFLTGFGTTSVKTENIVNVPEALKSGESDVFHVPSLQEIEKERTYTTPIVLGNSYIGFKEALAFKESQGDYGIVNTLGYLGKYQFGSGTLRLMGVINTTQFLNDPILQENIFKMNIARNKWILRREIQTFVGKKMRGIVISESGIVAAAHLAGPGNVQKFLHSYGRFDIADAYGTSLKYYMKRFSGFDISSVTPKRNPKVES